MFWVMALKGFVAVALFGIALGLSRLILAFVPEGRLRRLLTRPIGAGANRQRH
jgi:hypothetical protein